MPQSPKTKPAKANETVDQDSLGLKTLAKAILAREFRPRVSSVRRLAEAVLEERKKPKGKKKSSSGKKRKLAKIPGQKKDRKKGK